MIVRTYFDAGDVGLRDCVPVDLPAVLVNPL